MADEEIECPRCGQPWVGKANSPFWQEARYRAEGRAHTPAARSEEAQTIPGGFCGLCGAPLPQPKPKRKPKVANIPTVLPADSVDEVEVVEEDVAVPPAGKAEAITVSPPQEREARPAVPKAHAEAPPRVRRPSAVPESRPRSTPSAGPRIRGLSLYIWIPLVLAALALLVMVPLCLFFLLTAVRKTPGLPSANHKPPSALDVSRPIAYWSFDEGAGAEARDSSGNGQHARLVNAQRIDGIRGKALRFRGAGSYLDYSALPRLSFAAGEPFTLAFWTRTTRAQGTLLSQRNSRDGGAVIDLLLKNGRVQAQVRRDRDEGSMPATIDGGLLNDGAWHHVALSRKGNRIELFLDGVSQGQAIKDQASGAITTDLRALGSERYWVHHAAFGDPDFEGDMDEFCLFNRALSAKEITSLAGR